MPYLAVPSSGEILRATAEKSPPRNGQRPANRRNAPGTRGAPLPKAGVKLSIVIPTFCEEQWVEEAVRSAQQVADEVIVADGNSTDATAMLARRGGARVLLAPKGRGQQLDAGARAAEGDVLLFLHADARLPAGARQAIFDALADNAICGGNFRLRFAPASPWANLFSWACDIRRRALRVYYGDSAIFMRRSVYHELGGFPVLPLMEDYQLAQKLERHGRTAYLRAVQVEVSSRRFAAAPMKVMAQWTVVQSLYSLGVPSRHLVHLYRDKAR